MRTSSCCPAFHQVLWLHVGTQIRSQSVLCIVPRGGSGGPSAKRPLPCSAETPEGQRENDGGAANAASNKAAPAKKPRMVALQVAICTTPDAPCKQASRLLRRQCGNRWLRQCILAVQWAASACRDSQSVTLQDPAELGGPAGDGGALGSGAETGSLSSVPGLVLGQGHCGAALVGRLVTMCVERLRSGGCRRCTWLSRSGSHSCLHGSAQYTAPRTPRTASRVRPQVVMFASPANCKCKAVLQPPT